jgi:hypothetical protein
MFMCINALGEPMNIFVLDSDPAVSATMVADTHSIKMCLESAQMLSTALHHHGCPESEMPLTKSGTPYRPTHKNHPCTIWAQTTRLNFMWLVQHGLALCEEYRFRYGKQHACQQAIRRAYDLAHWIPDGELTPFAQAMPDEFKHENAVVAYRRYYIEGKSGIAKWEKSRPAPKWFTRH